MAAAPPVAPKSGVGRIKRSFRDRLTPLYVSCRKSLGRQPLTPAPSDRAADQLRRQRLLSVFEHAPFTLSVTVINVVITAAVLSTVDHTGRPAAWAAAVSAVSAARWISGRTFLRRLSAATGDRRWAMVSVGGSFATGVLWGLCATALFPASEWHQLFLSFVIGGMCAGALSVNAAHLPTVLAFILPAGLPLAASFLAQGSVWRVPALLIVIFAMALSMIARAAHRAFGERVWLQLSLDKERRELSGANAQLLEEVTQRRAAEATLHQVQKMDAVGHLAGGIAHDFNNLLQVIIGNMDLIRRAKGDQIRITSYADAVEHAALRGAELTHSLLAFARRQIPQTEAANVNLLLREFEPILLRTIGATIRFDIALAPNLPQCQVDASQFQSAVLNLVINARDAMPEGGRLSIATGAATLDTADLVDNPDAQPGRFVAVTVRDTGYGMSAEVMSHVFEPFFTTKEVGKGSGLGLAQVYGFARQSRGHVRLVSSVDVGTEATLLLPVWPGDASGPGREAVSASG